MGDKNTVQDGTFSAQVDQALLKRTHRIPLPLMLIETKTNANKQRSNCLQNQTDTILGCVENKDEDGTRTSEGSG